MGNASPNYLYWNTKNKTNGLVTENQNEITEYWNGETSDDSIVGVVNYVVKNNQGETLIKRRFGVLPKNFKLVLVAGKNINQATIKIYSLSTCDVELATDDLDSKLLVKDDYKQLQISSTNKLPPKEITLNILSSNNKSISIIVPYPVAGAIVFDSEGKEITKHVLSLNDLLGARLHMLAQTGRSERFTISLELPHAKFSPREEFVFNVREKPDIRSLYSFKDTIRDFLSLDNSLDAYVILSIRSHQKELKFKIQRYDNGLVQKRNTDEINLETPLGIEKQCSPEMQAMLLDSPEQHSIRLPEKLSEGVGTGTFLTADLKEGPWLIYPSEASCVQFRSLLFWGESNAVINYQQEASSLYQAVRLYHPSENPNVISDRIKKMTEDFDDSGWRYLKVLLENYSHLPLSTFEVWKEISRQEEALAMVIFRLDLSLEFIIRVELELSVIWEKVTLQSWVLAKSKFARWLEQSGVTSDILVKERVIQLTGYYRGLEGMDKYMESENPSDINERLTVLFESKILHGVWYQDLRRVHAENIWPVWLGVKLRAWMKDNNLEKYIGISNIEYSNAVTFFPFFMAAVTAGKVQLSDIIENEVHANYFTKSLRDFDHDWFYPVYSASLSMFLSKNI
ncbi:MAG: STY4851/ECs_5259 family protein [Methylococcaceae bacterium]